MSCFNASAIDLLVTKPNRGKSTGCYRHWKMEQCTIRRNKPCQSRATGPQNGKRRSFQHDICLQINSQLKAVGGKWEGMGTGRRRDPSRGHIPEAKAVLLSPKCSGNKDRGERQWHSQWSAVCILQQGELLSTGEDRRILVYYKLGSGKKMLVK